MKVLFIDVVKQPHYGGPGPHRFELVRNLSGFVDIYCISATECLSATTKIHAINLKRRDRFFLINKLIYLKSLFKLAVSKKYNIIYIRNLYPGLIGYLITKITGSKLVFELNSITKDDFKFIRSSENQLFNLKVYFVNKVELFLAKKSDAVIAITEGIKEHLVENCVDCEKIAVINNGVNVDIFKPIEKQRTDKLKWEYGVEKTDLIILFQGSLVGYQGIKYLIESAPSVIANVPNVKFLIIGDGMERSNLIKLVEKNNLSSDFIFTGRIEYDKMPEYINLADICTAPFIRERNETIGLSPLKLYEYMACEKVVVASNIKGVGDLLDDSKAGIAVTPESSMELADAIIELLNDKNLRENMGLNGRKACLEKHSWFYVARKTKEVFDSLLKEE